MRATHPSTLIGALLAAALAACANPPTAPAPAAPSPKPPKPAAALAAPSAPAAAPTKAAKSGVSASARRAASSWKANDATVALIKAEEGLRLTAYSDGARWLIGYGHTRTAKAGMRITEAQAEALLREDLADCERALGDAIVVPVSENEFGALVSLCYNMGAYRVRQTRVMTLLNQGEYAGAADAFLTHTVGTINGVRRELPVLRARREKERALFLSR